MDEFSNRFIKRNSFEIEGDSFGKRDNYYDLSFGDKTSRTVITCHKSHLEDLLESLVSSLDSEGL